MAPGKSVITGMVVESFSEVVTLILFNSLTRQGRKENISPRPTAKFRSLLKCVVISY